MRMIKLVEQILHVSNFYGKHDVLCCARNALNAKIDLVATTTKLHNAKASVDKIWSKRGRRRNRSLTWRGI